MTRNMIDGMIDGVVRPVGPRVLIVDDDEDQRRLVARLFTKAGVPDLHEAADAEEAILAARQHQPDLIVLDLAMPGRSGFDVLPDLRLAAEGAQVVVLSNLPRHRLVHHLERRGAIAFVEKRIAPSDLVPTILLAAELTDLTRRHVLHLAAEPASVRLGRRFVGGLLAESDQAIAGDVELLVSELLTNAVLHASSEPKLEVRISPTTVRVDVHDDDPRPPVLRDPSPDAVGGRGLHLVAEIAARWGTEPTPTGKVVWFELAR